MIQKWLSLAVVATILLIVAGKPIRRDNSFQCASSPCQNNGICRLTYPITDAPTTSAYATSAYATNAPTTKASRITITKASRITKAPTTKAPTTTKAATTIKAKGKNGREAYPTRTDSDGYTCECPPGWKDDKCQTDVDECVYSTCNHGKSCKNIPGSWQCDDIDECKPNNGKGNCKNNANCNNGDNDYSCDCSVSFKGKDCDEDVDECAYNRGNCRDGTDCENTYGGRNCNDIDECKPNYGNGKCKNNAKCNNGDNDYSCDCSVSFKGKDCDEDVDECEYNRGNCKSGTDCENTYGGRNCNDIDECKPNYGNGKCKNNAKCNNGDDDYSCDCSEFFKGKDCDEDVDECEYNRGNCKSGTDCENTYGGRNCNDIDECKGNNGKGNCENNANCNNGDNDYSCDCSEFFKGKNCDEDVNECDLNYGDCPAGTTCENYYGGRNCVDINECESAPCLYGGTCINGDNMYTCDCSTARTAPLELNLGEGNSGWTGVNCEVNVDECTDGFSSGGFSSCGAEQQCFDLPGLYDCEDLGCQAVLQECQNGGSCIGTVEINQPNAPQCQCPTGFTGPTCAANIIECDTPNMCPDGTTCLDTFGSYDCLDVCASQPCQNGGTCSVVPGGYANGFEYRCACTAEFEGTNCEKVYVASTRSPYASTKTPSTRSPYASTKKPKKAPKGNSGKHN